MIEFLKFHDTLIVAQSNWFWLLVAFGLGIWVGWRSAGPDGADARGTS